MKLSYTKIIFFFLAFNTILINLKAQCFKQTSAGYAHTVAIKNDGTLWTWGLNDYGQLGDGTTLNRNVPKQIGSDNDWAIISAGFAHTVAIKNNGSLWAWGWNGNGQLGNGTNIDKLIPTQIGTATNWAKISSGYRHTLALKTDSSLWAFGINVSGELGDGTQIDKNIPVAIGTTKYKSISAGGYHSLAIKFDGTLWAWGSNVIGQIGDSTKTDKRSPTVIGISNNWNIISASSAQSYAIKSDGSLWSWGQNLNGELGNGTNFDTITPIRIDNNNNWLNIASSNGFAIATKTDSSLWSWGWNSKGQLGDGSTTPSNIPKRIGSSTNWKILSPSFGSHTVALKNDGLLWSWGNNASGQLGNGGNSDVYLPISLTCPTTLPIILHYFTATKKENTSILQWQSTAEINAKAYYIERTFDGFKFEKIAKIDAVELATAYKWVDNNLPKENNIYYRLQLIDVDGKYSYSEVRTINFFNFTKHIKIYPNPVSDGKLKIDVEEEVNGNNNYIITTYDGRVIQQGLLTHQQQTLNIQNLSKGIYIIKFAKMHKQFIVL
jgi:alpha-tubulin suppressor-like RCC1 family protein